MAASEVDTHLVVVAIDIGTAYSGYAFSFRGNPHRVQFNNAWVAGSDKLMSQKTPTSVLLNPQKKFEAFGYEAENLYGDLSDDKKHHGWYLFRQFKMGLHGHKDLKPNTTIKDISGKEMPAMTIFTHAIRYLRQHSLTTLNKLHTFTIAESDILYVLTVPAIWSDKAKQFMRRAGKEAGIPATSLRIALEPEAASLWGQTINEESGASLSETGIKYLIVDLGGGTADITAHEKMPDGNLKELCRPTGGPWGGTAVDEEYLKFLETLAGADVMERLQKEEMADYFHILREFETNKRSFSPKSDGKSETKTIRIPINLVSTCEEQGMSLREKINQSTFKDTVFVKADKLRVDSTVIMDLFKKPINHICDHLKELFKEPELQDTKLILLVGGFGECVIVQDALRQAFPEKKLIIPKDTGLTVLKGAVRFGHMPNIIWPRKSKFTYGTDNYVLFDKKCHPKRKAFTIFGKTWCRDLFVKLVGMNEELSVGKEVTMILEPLDIMQSKTAGKIYYSENPDPEFVTDPGCHLIGKILVDVPDGETESDKDVLVKIKFWDTEITVTATVMKTGEKCEATFDCLF